MKNKPIIQVFIMLFAIVWIMPTKEMVQSKHFQEVEQYNPKYTNYTDDEMMHECDDHGLIYDYEQGICVTKKQWLKQQQQ